jgi:hypothetical protein
LKRILHFAASMALLSAFATGAAAQSGTWRATGSQARPRVAAEAPRPQTIIVVAPTAQYQPVYGNPYAYPVAYTVLPAVVMSDGSIWADFGYGYVPVSRACAVASTALNTQPTVFAGNGVVLSGPPTYMQPAPAQPTASQQMISSGQTTGQTNVQISAAQSACYSRDANGRVFVIR